MARTGFEALDDWVRAGLITEDQATAIRERESAAQQGELPGWVEPVAYLGAALVGVALFLFGVQLWDQLTDWGRIALAALITLVLFVVGAALDRSESAPAKRASSFAWFLTVAGVGTTAGLILSDVLDLDPYWEPVLSTGLALVVAVLLYLLAQRTLQQVAIAISTVSLLVALPRLLPLGDEAWVFGLLSLAIGATWMLLTWGGYLTPATTGWVLGSLFAIAVGFGAIDDNAFWSGLGILVGLGLVWLSTRIDRRSLLGLGVLALVIWIPTTVTMLFEESVAVPVAILITGFVTLTVVIAAIRLGHRGADTQLSGGSDAQG